VPKPNRYSQLIARVFLDRFSSGQSRISFDRDEFQAAADALGIDLPKNLGDIVYSFRYRIALPEEITARAPEGQEWVIRGAGPGRYCFSLVPMATFRPQRRLVTTRLPDATPGVIDRYALSDEQSLLAKLRYNRLVDIFTGLTCYSLQSHLRTALPDLGQIETDEVYVGIDSHGAHYVLPVEAKTATDSVGVVQIEQDWALCEHRFPGLIPQPIAAQYLEDGSIAIFSFARLSEEIRIANERHYALVPQSDLTDDEMAQYRRLSDAETRQR